MHWSVPSGSIFIDLALSGAFQAISLLSDPGPNSEILLQQLFKSASETYNLTLEETKYCYISKVVPTSTRLNIAGNTFDDIQCGIHRIAVACKEILCVTSHSDPLSILCVFSAEEDCKYVEQLNIRGLCVSLACPATLKLPTLPNCSILRYNSFIDREAIIQEVVQSNRLDGVVFISSDDAGARNIKNLRQDLFLTWITDLPVAPSLEACVESAYCQLISAKANLLLTRSNIVGDNKRAISVFVTPEKGAIFSSPTADSVDLANLLAQRISRRHYRTNVVMTEEYLSLFSEQISLIKDTVRRGFLLGFFPPYFADSRSPNPHFGFVACKTSTPANPHGFLITARGSNKSNLQDADIVYVPSCDSTSRIIDVHSCAGRRGSLNANTAALLFARVPHCNIILHVHATNLLSNRIGPHFSVS